MDEGLLEMNIKQFKEFEKDFVFKGIVEDRELLKTVRNHTFLSSVVYTCELVEASLMDSNRKKVHKNGVIFFSYILYVCEFTSGMYDNFDKILQWLNKDIKAYVNEVTIKEALDR